MSEHEEQLERIRGKLAEVRARRPETFGSGSHRYALGSPLDEATLRAFEVERGLTLPSGYRAFLLGVGHGGPGPHGGAGPYYGLYALEQWGEYHDWIGADLQSGWLCRPSPLRPGPNRLPEIDDEVDDDAWPPPELAQMYDGMLTLGTRGCSYMIGLVVTGECRGRVVYVDASHLEDPYVVRDADFLDWYERWLDELLAGVASDWFGYGPAGDEAVLLHIVAATADATLRVEAVQNLAKLPARTAAVWEALRPLLQAPDEPLRVAALQVFAGAPAEETEAIAPLLTAVEPEVRRTACRVLMRVDPLRYAPDVTQLLFEDDAAGVREDAFFALQPRGKLDQDTLVRIAADPRMGDLRRSAAYHVQWQPGHAELLERLVADPDEQLSGLARNALRALGLA